MKQILIVCVEDEPEVRMAVERDLEPFLEYFAMEMAEDSADARTVIDEYREKGIPLGLILADHVMPGITGVDLLVELNNDPTTRAARKVLITGQASHEDTIEAINEADLDHYIAKPWTAQTLREVVRGQLTDYVLEAEVDVVPYLQILDAERLLESLRRG